MDDADPELDALRRRLYAPDATEEDLARYRAAAAARPAHAAEPDPPPAPSRRRVPLAALVLVPAVLLAAALSIRSAVVVAPVASVAPSPGSSPLVVAEDARAGFVTALEAGRSPDLVGRLITRPTERPRALADATRAAAQERWGAGPGTIELRPPAAHQGGRVTVILLTDRPTEAGWSAGRVAAREDHSRYRQEVAAGRFDLEPGVPHSATFTAADGPPTRLAIDVVRNVRWDAVVVFTD